MSAASDLIARLEQETGQRVDSDDGNNDAMAGLFGALSRIMEQSPPSYTEKADVAAGLVIKHQMSAEYQQEQKDKQLMALMVMNGLL